MRPGIYARGEDPSNLPLPLSLTHPIVSINQSESIPVSIMCWPSIEGGIEIEERRRKYVERGKRRRFVWSKGEETDEWTLINPNRPNYNPYERPRYDHSRRYMQSAALDAPLSAGPAPDTFEEEAEAIDDTLEATQNTETVETTDVTEDRPAPRQRHGGFFNVAEVLSVFRKLRHSLRLTDEEMGNQHNVKVSLANIGKSMATNGPLGVIEGTKRIALLTFARDASSKKGAAIRICSQVSH